MAARPGNRAWSVVKALEGARPVRMLPREHLVLRLRRRGETLAAIAERLSVTRERVRQIERVAQRKQRTATGTRAR